MAVFYWSVWLLLSAGSMLLAADRPNIVIIVADDLGWADVSFHGHEIRTPHIDRLTREGAELNRFYVAPVCSPTRAGLMTGRYPIRYGLMRTVVPPWRKGGLDVSEVTLPEVLARAGYHHRGVFGKWHLGHSAVKYHPLRRGFTEFVGHYNGAIDYFTHQREGELDWHTGYESNHDEGYSTDLIAAAAVDFINRRAGDPTPFLCYVPFNSPHGPLQAKPEDLARYESLAGSGPPFRDRPGEGAATQTRPAFGGEGRGKSQRQTLAAMISSLDDGVGAILKALEERGIAGDTLVWFFSDNGGTGVGDNRPLRGAKGSVFEGGIRVTAALRWPARVSAGRTVTAPLAYIDVLPTLMQIVGVEDHAGKPLDGIPALDLLTGSERELTRELYSYIGHGEAEQITLIEPEWKLIVIGPRITDPPATEERKVHLFRISSDPYEKNDVAPENPIVVHRMLTKLREFRTLQPADAVAPYFERDPAFKAPLEWRMPGQ